VGPAVALAAATAATAAAVAAKAVGTAAEAIRSAGATPREAQQLSVAGGVKITRNNILQNRPKKRNPTSHVGSWVIKTKNNRPVCLFLFFYFFGAPWAGSGCSGWQWAVDLKHGLVGCGLLPASCFSSDRGGNIGISGGAGGWIAFLVCRCCYWPLRWAVFWVGMSRVSVVPAMNQSCRLSNCSDGIITLKVHFKALDML
jgi:hypothetical protein